MLPHGSSTLLNINGFGRNDKSCIICANRVTIIEHAIEFIQGPTLGFKCKYCKNLVIHIACMTFE